MKRSTPPVANLLLPAAAILCGFILTACGDPPAEKRGCDDVEVQTLAKKLVVMHFDEMAAQKGSSQRMMDQLMREKNPDFGTTLNTIKSKSVNAGRVSLSEVEQIRAPADAKSAKTTPDEDGYLFICSARARIKLAGASIEKLAKSNLGKQEELAVQGDTIAPHITYTTSANKDGQLEVGMAISNPMLDMLLSVLLRDANQEADGQAPTTPN